MSTTERDPLAPPGEAPLELEDRACAPPVGVSDDEALLGPSLYRSTLRPDPTPRRMALLAVAGFLLICLAGIARVALDQAAPPPPGVVEPTAAQDRGGIPQLDTSVARYEYERARALR